jgi:hypothetical protein
MSWLEFNGEDNDTYDDDEFDAAAPSRGKRRENEEDVDDLTENLEEQSLEEHEAEAEQNKRSSVVKKTLKSPDLKIESKKTSPINFNSEWKEVKITVKFSSSLEDLNMANTNDASASKNKHLVGPNGKFPFVGLCKDPSKPIFGYPESGSIQPDTKPHIVSQIEVIAAQSDFPCSLGVNVEGSSKICDSVHWSPNNTAANFVIQKLQTNCVQECLISNGKLSNDHSFVKKYASYLTNDEAMDKGLIFLPNEMTMIPKGHALEEVIEKRAALKRISNPLEGTLSNGYYTTTTLLVDRAKKALKRDFENFLPLCNLNNVGLHFSRFIASSPEVWCDSEEIFDNMKASDMKRHTLSKINTAAVTLKITYKVV